MQEVPSWQRHELDEDDEHDADECYACLLQQQVSTRCRCGDCCRRMIIEVSLKDAEREPKIAERCSPLYFPGELTQSGAREHVGYLLNDTQTTGDTACVFLDRKTSQCTIYDTRPLTCRLFDCDGNREQLIELGIIDRQDSRII